MKKNAQTNSRPTQTDPFDEAALRTHINRMFEHRSENLCVIGMKVEEKEVWLGDGEVGTQTVLMLPRVYSTNKEVMVGRGSLRMPKFFNVAPMKENNFLPRDYSLRR